MRYVLKLAASIGAASLGFVIASISTAASAETVVIQDAKIHTVAGNNSARVIEDGDIIVRDGHIVSVGRNLSAPEGATVISANGRVVTPGIIAPWSQLGLVEIGLDREANDASTRDGFELSAALDAVDGYNSSSTLIPINRSGGITRALSAPTAGDKMFGGQAALIDLSGKPDSVMQAKIAQSVVIGYGGARRNGDSRLAAYAVLRETLDEARAYATSPHEYLRRNIDDRFEVADLKALGPVVDGDQLLIVSVDSASEIRNVIRLKNEYDLNIAILGGSEAWKVGAALAAADIPVILNPLANLPSQFEDLGATLENAARLHRARVKISFYGPPSGTHNLRFLTQLAGNAVSYGLPYAEGIAALTRNPAELLGVGDKLGSIGVGKIADLVIWDGDPLEVTSRPVGVLINGQIMDMSNRQTILRDRYKDLERGDLPFAYRGAE